MKIVVTNYTGDRGNWGCQATSRNLLAFLRRTFPDVDPADIRTIPLPRGHELDQMIEARFGGRVRGIYAKRHPSRGDLDFLERLTRERFGSYFDLARDADVIVFQGEGSVGPDIHYRGLRLFALPFLAGHLWRKPVLSLNQTLYASSPADSRVLSAIFNSFDLVAVREAASYAFARGIGIDSAVLCPDMAFGEARSIGTAPPSVAGARFFCVTGSAANSLFDGRDFSRTIRAIAERHGLMPVFIYSREGDSEFLKQVISGLGPVRYQAITAKDYPEVESIIPVLRDAKFVIGGRYHTAVSALSQSTPIILLPGNTFKSEGIAPMLGLDCAVLDPRDAAGILARIDAIVAGEAGLRDEIARAIARIAASYDALSALLREIVAARAAGRAEKAVPAEILTPDLAGSGSFDRFRTIYRQRNRDAAPGLRYAKYLLRRLTGRGRVERTIEETLNEQT